MSLKKAEKEINEIFVARMRCRNIGGKTLCEVTIPIKLVRMHDLKHGNILVMKLLKSIDLEES